MFTVIVPNTGYYMWDIKKSNENGIYPGFYYIRITSEKNPDISDNSDDLFYIYGEGSYIVTMPPESVTYNSAILKGELKNLEGRIRFRYREKDEINWIYPSDWHGEYGNGPFDETVSGLLPSKKYEYQAGVKLWNDVEIWGIGYYFMTILHEGFVNQTTIPKEGISDLGDNTWSIQLPITINGTTVIDLYATIGPCFLAGTKVLMADGSYKKIEDVKIGDFVKSYEEQTGIFVDKKVINVFHHDAEEMTEYYMIINDHLKVTPNHKFYSNGRWALAENLKIGDALFSKAYGDEYTVNSIDYVYKKMPTFDLEIYDCHNYFVSIDEGVDVLVHNENDEIRFGTIWIFDSNSLVYTRTDRGLTDSYVLEKNGIVSYLGGDWFVEQNPQIYSSSNLFSINVVRTLFSFFSISVSHSDMLKFKLYSNLNSSYIGETKKVYNLRLQFEGDYANEWGDYLKQKYSFEDDSVPTDYISLRCINSEYGINLALAHSVVNLRLEP